jgi:hypothetical protein
MERGRFAGTLTAMNRDDFEPPTSDRELALRRLKKQRDFQGHLVAYVVVNAAVWAIWAFTGSGYPWPAWLTGCWGIGLILNAWDVYWRRPITETDIERELERLHAGR